MNEQEYENIKEYIIKFLNNYLTRSNANGFVIGVSGGIDSAVVATLCKLATPKTYALLMPTSFSSDQNLTDAIELCNKIKIQYKVINIQNILNQFNQTIGENLDKLRFGNLSARVRMSILYDYSAKENLLVVGTSNKSELMLGYGTIYGDMACALNPIGNIYKSDIFKFAKFLQIDQKIIQKAPSADLWKGQTDEDDLGYTYDILDQVLKFIEKNSCDIDKLNQEFNDNKLIESVITRVNKNKFKRELPAIANLKE